MRKEIEFLRKRKQQWCREKNRSYQVESEIILPHFFGFLLTNMHILM